MKNKGLGRGLDALLSAGENLANDEQRRISVHSLQPGKYQPRTKMDQASLQELAESIRAQGLVQPILVRRIGNALENGFDGERYEIIAGERRWRAAQMAGLGDVPALIRNIPDEQALAMALIENIQRENLNPLEEAQGLQRLIDEFGLTHEEAGNAVGRSRSAATNLLRLQQLTPPVQEMLMDARLDMGHARALLALEGASQIQLAQHIAQKGLSVREAEHLVQVALKPPKAAGAEEKPDQDLLNLQETLSNTLGAVVQIRANRKGSGRLSIDFSSLDQLDTILKRIR